MLNAVPSLILAFVILGIAPILIGNTMCGMLKLDIKLSNSYVLGYIGLWALFQLIAVPLVLLKQNFMIVVVIISGAVIGMIIYGIKNKYYNFRLPEFENWGDRFAFVVMCMSIVALLVTTALLQHTDADDSRFVVNAVDIVRTNKMFLTNPATGEAIPHWSGELVKDVTSPWAVFIAYCAKVTDIHPTIMAHSVLQLVLTFMLCLVYWMLSDVFFKGDITSRSIFVCLVLLIHVYGYYSKYSAQTFGIIRIWQGKAVVASIGIPLIYLVSMWIYDDYKKKSQYVLLFLVSMAMCLMSGMGIVISAVMIGCISVVYGLMKKDARVFLGVLMAAVPGALYYVINSMNG